MRFTPTLVAYACAMAVATGCAATQANKEANNGDTQTKTTSATTPIILQTVQAADMRNNAQSECDGNMRSSYFYNVNGEKAPEAKINATGYGAPPKSFYPEPQRRLMAMRAAKIDAYRSLAERVNGMQIWGGTTIGDMVVEKDRFRVFLDTHLRGARVIAENQQEDGTYETIVEINVDQGLLKTVLPGSPCDDKGEKAPNAVQRQSNTFKHANFSETASAKPSSTSNFYYRVE